MNTVDSVYAYSFVCIHNNTDYKREGNDLKEGREGEGNEVFVIIF